MKKINNLVIIESPYRGKGYEETEINILYAQACIQDSLNRGEFPYASHLFFTQQGLLDDKNPKERTKGIMTGLEWGKMASTKVVYTDRGISEGMQKGIDFSKEIGQEVIKRKLENYRLFLGNITSTDIERVQKQFIF